MAEDAKNRIDVVVVVSGEDVHVSVNKNQKVSQLVREALRESGNAGQPPENWVLKSDAGNIDLDQRISDAGITSGMKLYLNPKVGEGGA